MFSYKIDNDVGASCRGDPACSPRQLAEAFFHVVHSYRAEPVLFLTCFAGALEMAAVAALGSVFRIL
jgi:hypothetical protein